jgi:ribonucleoside-triphosphate reductase
LSEKLADEVVRIAEQMYLDGVADVEGIQDIVEKVLIENGTPERRKRTSVPREKALPRASPTPSSARRLACFRNTQRQGLADQRKRQHPEVINGLNNYIREAFTKNYWLHEVYPDEVRNAHMSGDIPHPRPGLLRPLLRRLGPATDPDAGLRRRTGQGGI